MKLKQPSRNNQLNWFVKTQSSVTELNSYYSTYFASCLLYSKSLLLDCFPCIWVIMSTVQYILRIQESTQIHISIDSYTLKTPGSDLTRKGSHGARPISGSDWSGIWVKLTRNLSKKCLSDSDSGSVWPGVLVGSDPKMGLASRDPFRVESDPRVVRVLVRVVCLFVMFVSYFSLVLGYCCKAFHYKPSGHAFMLLYTLPVL